MEGGSRSKLILMKQMFQNSMSRCLRRILWGYYFQFFSQVLRDVLSLARCTVMKVLPWCWLLSMRLKFSHFPLSISNAFWKRQYQHQSAALSLLPFLTHILRVPVCYFIKIAPSAKIVPSSAEHREKRGAVFFVARCAREDDVVIFAAHPKEDVRSSWRT